MMDTLAWLKRRIDAMFAPWLMFVFLLIINFISNFNIGMIPIVAAYFLPVPFFVKLYRIYYWCASWCRHDAGIIA